MNGAFRPVGTWQVAEAHKELVHDFAARKLERLLKPFGPSCTVKTAALVQPAREAAVTDSKLRDHLGVVDRRRYFQAVANNSRIG